MIGWLYQYYISERKDEVFEGLKRVRRSGPENFPAATQLFTPHWIVRYLVENSLGRLWMLNHPESKSGRADGVLHPPGKAGIGLFADQRAPRKSRFCDPACGTGHMLTYAFDLLEAIYEEEGYQANDIPR